MNVALTNDLFIQSLLEESISRKAIPKASAIKILKLTGDASTRKYYRAEIDQKTYVVCLEDPSPSDETNFTAIQKVLHQHKIRVPAIYDTQLGKGFLLEEDLGNTTFLSLLASATSSENLMAYYANALNLMIQMHSIPTQNYPKAVFNQYCFDQEKLMQEVSLTVENFIKGYLNYELSPSEEEVLVNGFRQVIKPVVAQKMVFTHRDYHSRNLMMVGNELCVIDFQDARMGAPQYDLVSLLEDSYFQLSSEKKNRLKMEYWEKFLKGSGLQTDYNDYLNIYNRMACQRIFKAIGSFSYIYRTRSDARYLKYIGNSFENLRVFLEQIPEMKEATLLLKKIYYGS